MGTQIVLAVALAAAFIITFTVVIAGRRWLLPDDFPPPQHAAPRHARPHHSAAERIPTAGELAAWREDWTGAELQALRGDPAPPAAPGPAWSFHRWEIEQEQWLEARRREAHEYALVLRSGAWADPWWTRH